MTQLSRCVWRTVRGHSRRIRPFLVRLRYPRTNLGRRAGTFCGGPTLVGRGRRFSDAVRRVTVGGVAEFLELATGCGVARAWRHRLKHGGRTWAEVRGTVRRVTVGGVAEFLDSSRAAVSPARDGIGSMRRPDVADRGRRDPTRLLDASGCNASALAQHETPRQGPIRHPSVTVPTLALPFIVRKDGQNNRPGGMMSTFRNATGVTSTQRIGARGCARSWRC